jgi:hypothetical protein
VGWYVVEGVDGMGRVSGGVRRVFLYGWEMGDGRWGEVVEWVGLGIDGGDGCGEVMS